MKIGWWSRTVAALHYDCGWATHPGAVRARNEDGVLAPTFISIPGDGLVLFAAVADGVGGMQSGDVASSAAIATLTLAFRPESEADLGSALLHAASACHAALVKLNEDRQEGAAMASTLVAVAMHGTSARIVHVGDSRAYLLRGRRLLQLTKDHTLVADAIEAGDIAVAEADGSSMANVLTRALGQAGGEPDLSGEVRLRPGDRFLLCSDGIHGTVSAELLTQALRRQESAQSLADACVNLALEHGGPDNASAVVIRVEPARNGS